MLWFCTIMSRETYANQFEYQTISYTACLTEMRNILQTFHLKTDKHALILNSKKGGEAYEHTPT